MDQSLQLPPNEANSSSEIYSNNPQADLTKKLDIHSAPEQRNGLFSPALNSEDAPVSYPNSNPNTLNRNGGKLSLVRLKVSNFNSKLNVFKKKSFSKTPNDLESQPLLQNDNPSQSQSQPYSNSANNQSNSIEIEPQNTITNGSVTETTYGPPSSIRPPAGNAYDCPFQLYPNSQAWQTSLYIILGLFVTSVSIVLISTGQFDLLFRFLKHMFCDFYQDSPFSFCTAMNLDI